MSPVPAGTAYVESGKSPAAPPAAGGSRAAGAGSQEAGSDAGRDDTSRRASEEASGLGSSGGGTVPLFVPQPAPTPNPQGAGGTPSSGSQGAGGGGGGGGGGSSAGQAALPSLVRMIPSAGQVVVGSLLSIRIEISGAHDVGSVPFHVVYNPAVLKFVAGHEGGFLRGGGRATAFFTAPMSSGSEMVVGLSRLGAGGGIAGAGELCTLDFEVVGPGDAGLAFTRAHVRDSANRILQADFEPATVSALE